MSGFSRRFWGATPEEIDAAIRLSLWPNFLAFERARSAQSFKKPPSEALLKRLF